MNLASSLLTALLLSTIFLCADAENCGPALSNLLRDCGNKHLANPKRCCQALRNFNADLCWCQLPSYFAAADLSSNLYAYTARAKFCAISNQKTIDVPHSRRPRSETTKCPKIQLSKNEFTSTTRCAANSALRKKRIDTIRTLDNLLLNSISTSSLNAFRNQLNSLLTSDVVLSSIGIVSLKGRSDATDFLVSRQKQAGNQLPWASTSPQKVRMMVTWTKSNVVGYTWMYNDFSVVMHTRRTFITFAACSSKIQKLYVLEPYLFSAISTPNLFKERKNPLSQFNSSLEIICNRINTSCGRINPYASLVQCIAFMRKLRSSGRAMCFRRSNPLYFPQIAVGDTVACRVTYSLMATSNPSKYCPLLGVKAGGMCTYSMCKPNQYGDFFKFTIPRKEIRQGFETANNGELVEVWPLK